VFIDTSPDSEPAAQIPRPRSTLGDLAELAPDIRRFEQRADG